MMKKQHQSETRWIGEINEKLGYKLLLKTSKILFEGESEYSKKIIIAETENLGKILILGEEEGLTLQFSEKYPIYDEMLANVPMNSHINPEKVLIIGGGDGAVLLNVLRYPEVKKVILVEIDKKVVDVAKKFFNHSWVFEDSRVNIIYEDGAKYIKNTNEKFDIIIGDYTDPYQGTPAESLVSLEFYKNAKRILRKNGIIAVQAGSPIYQLEILKDIYIKINKVFSNTKVYLSPSPIYPGGLWAYCISSLNNNKFKPLRSVKGTTYYNNEVHVSSFSLPNFLKVELKKI